jgi:hypothetical protein
VCSPVEEREVRGRERKKRTHSLFHFAPEFVLQKGKRDERE